MVNLKTTVKCKKNLTHSSGEKCFTKGNYYSGNICNILENLTVTNDNGQPHKLGGWSKHFTKIK